MSRQNPSRLDAMLSSDNKGVGHATGVLSRMFRQILFERNITTSIYNRLILRYLKDPRNRIGKDSKSQSSARGNLNKELTKEDMTWDNYIKGIRMLNPDEATMIMRFKWPNGAVTIHEMEFGPNGQEPTEVRSRSYSSVADYEQREK